MEEAQTDEERKQILVKNLNKTLIWALYNIYNPAVQFIFDTIPEFRANSEFYDAPGASLDNEIRRMYLFEKDNPKVKNDVTFERKENILVQILENIDPREADILIKILMKQQLAPGITTNLVKETFPNLLPEVEIDG